jgi:hypothetical protein
MKKAFTVLLLLSFALTLTGCRPIREIILKAPDEMKIPDGSSNAVCMKDEIEYTFVYQLDGVYLYYIDGIEQGDEQLNNIQEQAFLHGESMINYLNDEFGNTGCTITDYE